MTIGFDGTDVNLLTKSQKRGKLLINTICHLAHSIMLAKVLSVETAFTFCRRRYTELLNNRDIFDEAVETCKITSVFGVFNGYIYQTTSALVKQKSTEEIMDMIKTDTERIRQDQLTGD